MGSDRTTSRPLKDTTTASGAKVGRPRGAATATAAKLAQAKDDAQQAQTLARLTAGAVAKAEQRAEDAAAARNDASKTLEAAQRTYDQRVSGFGIRSMMNLPGQVTRITNARDVAQAVYRTASTNAMAAAAFAQRERANLAAAQAKANTAQVYYNGLLSARGKTSSGGGRRSTKTKTAGS
jgi:hypothetical protein